MCPPPLLFLTPSLFLSAASPNASYLWVQYMAYEVGLTELDRARAVAERALKSTHTTDTPAMAQKKKER
jgi:hypothetical protein